MNPKPFLHVVLLTLLVALVGVTATGCRKKTPEDRLAEAKQLIEERQMALSILKLKDLIAEHPEGDAAIEARIILAQLYVRLGGKENVKNSLDQLNAIWKQVGVKDPRGAESYILTVDLNRQMGNVDEAIRLAAEGVALLEKENPEMAAQLTLYHASILLSSQTPENIAEGVRILDEQMLNNAEAAIRGQAKEVLAAYYRDQKDYDASNAVYDRYLAAFPEDPSRAELIMAKAINMRIGGKAEEAEAIFAEGEQLMLAKINEELDAAKKSETRSVMARYYEGLRKFDKAEEMLRTIMSENPMSRDAIIAQFEIGHLYGRIGRWEDSLAMYEQIARENPNTSIAQNAQNFAGQLQEAMRQRAAAQQAPPPAEETMDPAAAPAETAPPETAPAENPAP